MMRATHSHLIVKLPHTSVQLFRRAVQEGTDAGDRQHQCLTGALLGRALADLGQRSDALPILRSTLVRAEQTHDPMPLSYPRGYLAQWLAESANPDDWQEATQLAFLSAQSNIPSVLGISHQVLAQVAQLRGDLGTAELEARTACQIHEKAVPYRAESAALWARILRQQGKTAESLKVCGDMLQQLDALGIEPYGILALYVELAETRERSEQRELARDALVQALPILRRRVEDIPDSAMRTSYLRQVPVNVRMLELCRQWGLDTLVLHPDA
jgi:hypothetical protein